MSELKWNLSDLFISDEEFYKEKDVIESLLCDINKYKDISLDSDNLLDLLNLYSVISERINNMLVYGSLRYYANIKDEKTKEIKTEAENFNNRVKNDLKFVQLKIIELGYDKVFQFVKDNNGLEKYRLFLSNIFRNREHIQSEDVNDVIKINNDEINSQLRFYNDMISEVQFGTVLIDDKEEKIDYSKYAKYVSSKDRNLRRDVYNVMNSTFLGLGKKASEILYNIKIKSIENAKLEGFNSVLDSVLFSENIDDTVIKSLIDSTNNNISLIQRYLKIKAKLEDIQEPHLYDLNVPVLPVSKNYSFMEAIDIIKKALEPLGEEYLKVIDILLNGHIDACSNLERHPSIIFSWHTYSFLQYKGTYGSLKDLAHELGHIVNYYLSKEKQPFIYEDSTVFVGETASIVNEILLNKYLYDISLTTQEKLFYLSKNIENYFTSVFKQVMYTEIENEIFSLIERDEYSLEILMQKYSDMRRKYFGDFINYDDEDNTEWIRLGKLFRWNYYSYKYATGLLIASNVVNSLIYDKSLSKSDYLEFLSLGSSMYSLDLLKLLHIDLSSSEIMNKGFRVLENEIKELEKILKI